MTEANPFSPEVLAKEAGLPVVDKSSSNPFAEFSTSTFVADDQEQRVIAAVNNPSIASPRNFGLVEIPATIANEMDRSLLSIPRDIGSTLLEAGELSQGMKGSTTAEVAMNSAQKRLIAAMQADSEPGLFGSDYLKIPSSYRLLGALWGVEKDVVLSTVSDGTVPTALINTGNAMMEQNRVATEALLGKPKSGIYADAGSGVGSVFKSIGAWYITKNPGAAGAYMGWTVNSNDYLEARAAGKTPEEAAAIAGVSALGQGKIEGIGMKVFAGAAATSGFFRRILFRAAEQSAEESAQGVVEETVKGVSGVRDTSFDDKLHNVLYQGALGFIVGAPVATVFSVMEKTATDSGLNPADIKKQMESFVKNKDKVVSGAVDLINKEMSDVTNNPADLQKAKQRMKEVLADDSANEQAATDQDPKAAARILLKTASAELRSAIESLPTGFTMEQLNQAVNSPEVLADTAMANSLALAEKQSSKWQALKEAFTGSVSDIVSARSLTKKQVMETQNRIIETINQSELPAEDRGKFLVAVRDTQTADQLVRSIDDINARIDKLVDSNKRKIAVSRIKATAKKAGNSSVIAVDIAKRIGQLAEEIDLQNRNPSTVKSLQKTMDYLNANPDAELPPAMLKQLDILNKKPLADVTTKELTDLADKLDTLVVRGKARLALIKEKAEDLKRERLSSIEKTAAPLSSKPISRANIGESLSTMDNIKNRYNELLNGAAEIGIALNPMDVFFDMLDGAKNYKGNVYKVFKKTIDASFSEYLNLKEEMTREVKSLSDKLNLNEKNYEKIGAWAVLQQQGGEKKLLDSGITQKEIDAMLASTKQNAADSINAAKRKFVYHGDLAAHSRGGKPLTEFSPSNKVMQGLRYDGGAGSVFGNHTYLDNTGRWVNNKQGLMIRADEVYKVETDFKKPFVLTPTNAGDLWAIMGKKGGVKGAEVTKRLQDKGYDALVIEGFDRHPVTAIPPEGLSDDAFESFLTNQSKIEADFVKETGIPPDWHQDQIVALDPSKTLKVVGKVDPKEALNYTKTFEEQIAALEADQVIPASPWLNDGEMQMYQLMRTKLDSMRPAIKDIMRRVYNKDFTEVDDYFPFLTDHEAMEDLSIQDQIGDNLPSISKRKNVERGFTKARTGGKQKVRIDAMGVFLKHMDNATYLVKMGEDIKALGDVATDSKYGAAVGDLGQKMTVEWIDLLARKGAVTGRIVGLDILRRNIGAAVLGFKLSSIFVQPTSLADGASLVGGNYVRRGVVAVTNTEWRQFLWDNMPEIRERAGDDPAYLNMGGDSILANVREAGFLALKFVDALSASSVAIGAYTKSVEQRGGEVDLTKPDKQAIQEAQLMMRRTQASAFSKDAPPVITQGKLTGSVSVDKLILQFQSFMLNRWSVLRHDLWRVGIKGGETKQAVNIATWMMIAAAGELMSRRLAVELIGSFFGNEPEKWDKTVNKEAVGVALGSVPFVSQAVSAFQYGSVPVPSLSVINRVFDEAKTAAQTKDEAKKNKHKVRAVLLGAGAVFGVPGMLQAEALLKEKKK
jgi:hypothetical protein